MRYFDESKIYTIQIESNLVCRQGCLYCYISSDHVQYKELPEQMIKSVLDSAAKMGVRTVDWLGGDPLERAGWFELMRYGEELGLRNNIWTSGIPLANPDTAEKAVIATKGGFISVHLDTIDEDLYGKLHSGNPAERIGQIIKGVDNILTLGKRPENIFNCITFTKILAGDDVMSTIDFFFEKKGIRTCLTQMCSVGSALEHPEWIPSLDEIREAISIRDSVNYPDSTTSMSTMDVNKFYCGGAICVTVDGDVTPCSVIRRGFGNIRDSSLETITERNKDSLLYTKLRDIGGLPDDCGTCKNNNVCWGCRASAFYESGDLLTMDPKCTISRI
jgi:radical SAM protein with 4Fe4S-binding SPASM domain